MKLLADENVHGDLVLWLRSQGHEVLYAAESLRTMPDDELLLLARDESRVLITDNKDFGDLVYHRKLVSHGVVLLRLETPSIAGRLERLAQVWPVIEAQAKGRFVVVTDRKIRVRGALRES